MRQDFYVYMYLDPRKPGVYRYGNFDFSHEPFYVGKGCGYRDKTHLYFAKSTDTKDFNLAKIRKILSIGKTPLIVRQKEHITESSALRLERLMVKTIGRYVIGEGPLTNLSEGGEKSFATGLNQFQLLVARYGMLRLKRDMIYGKGESVKIITIVLG